MSDGRHIAVVVRDTICYNSNRPLLSVELLVGYVLIWNRCCIEILRFMTGERKKIFDSVVLTSSPEVCATSTDFSSATTSPEL